VVQAVPVVRDLVDLGLAVRVDPMVRAGLDRMDPAAPVDRVGLDRVVRVGLVDLMGLAALVGLDRMDPVALVGLDRMDPVAPVGLDRMDLVAPVGLDRMDLVGLVVPTMVARVGLDRMDLVGRAVPNMVALVDLDPMDRVVPVALVVPVVPNMAARVAPADRRRPRMCNAVTTTVVARSGVDRGMRRTASARPITARRPRHGKTDSGGTVGLLRERHHPTGTGHRLLAAGTGRRPLVAGIPIGTGPDAI
jgi:hypothetical protein